MNGHKGATLSAAGDKYYDPHLLHKIGAGRAGTVVRNAGVCVLSPVFGHIVAPTACDFWILSRDSAINVSTFTKKSSSSIYPTGSFLGYRHRLRTKPGSHLIYRHHSSPARRSVLCL
jgi:hypothetical protein